MSGVGLAVLVALAGAAGAVGRSAVELAARARRPTATPVGTLAVNLSGSLALGALAGLALAHGLAPDVRTVIGTGFLGAFTTFSTYAVEVVQRFATGHRRVAVGYALGTTVGSSLAAAAGLALAGGW